MNNPITAGNHQHVSEPVPHPGRCGGNVETD